MLVASANHRHFLGTAVVFFRKGSKVARLYSLASKPDARGKGVGTSLVEAAEAAARRRRCHALRLEVRTDNLAAIRLYERLATAAIASSTASTKTAATAGAMKRRWDRRFPTRERTLLLKYRPAQVSRARRPA
ncbi:acetyltransferase [Rhodanobacter sp. 115]|nr:acetyltransferase [Rhodanobacter sp. 115]